MLEDKQRDNITRQYWYSAQIGADVIKNYWNW